MSVISYRRSIYYRWFFVIPETCPLFLIVDTYITGDFLLYLKHVHYFLSSIHILQVIFCYTWNMSIISYRRYIHYRWFFVIPETCPLFLIVDTYITGDFLLYLKHVHYFLSSIHTLQVIFCYISYTVNSDEAIMTALSSWVSHQTVKIWRRKKQSETSKCYVYGLTVFILLSNQLHSFIAKWTWPK